jgi:hypothetical protein
MKANEAIKQTNEKDLPQHLAYDYVEYHTGCRDENDDAINLSQCYISIYMVGANWDISESKATETLLQHGIRIYRAGEDPMITLLDYYYLANKLLMFPFNNVLQGGNYGRPGE